MTIQKRLARSNIAMLAIPLITAAVLGVAIGELVYRPGMGAWDRLAALRRASDVEAGLAIAELLSTMRTPTASLVLGGGHSIGVPLAVSCRRSFIVPSATMTVHPVRMNGLVLGVPQTLSYFEKMQDRIVRFIAHNAKISADDFRALMMKTGELVMDVGTVLDGAGAVDCGLIDQMGGLSDALAFLNRTIEEEHHAVDGH